jgi:enoyl-CoA hydratase/carnithine racemase
VTDTVLTSADDGVLVITLKRPAVKNAIGSERRGACSARSARSAR